MEWFGRRLEARVRGALGRADCGAAGAGRRRGRGGAPRAPAPTTAAEAAQQGEPLFKAHCASCHDPAVGRAPDRAQLDRLGTLEVLNALLNGSMRPMAQGMTTTQLGEIAAYVSPPKKEAAVPPPPDPPKCAKIEPFAPHKGDWPAWGLDAANRRNQTTGGIAAGDVPRLKVKWAFALAGGKEGQPTVVGGRVFIASFQGARLCARRRHRLPDLADRRRPFAHRDRRSRRWPPRPAAGRPSTATRPRSSTRSTPPTASRSGPPTSSRLTRWRS